MAVFGLARIKSKSIKVKKQIKVSVKKSELITVKVSIQQTIPLQVFFLIPFMIELRLRKSTVNTWLRSATNWLSCVILCPAQHRSPISQHWHVSTRLQLSARDLGTSVSDHSKHPLLLRPSAEEEVKYIPESLSCSGVASRHQKKNARGKASKYFRVCLSTHR